MLNSPVKRFILPFSQQKNREPFATKIEGAAVYALAELERNKGGGLILKQPEEKLRFIAEIGYPFWLFPNNSVAYIFDGLSNFSYSVPYVEFPTAKAFMENLEENSNTKEDYMTFLSDHNSYFVQPTKEKGFSLRNLIVDLDFKKEFELYRKEATVVTSQPSKSTLLPPTLQESTISSMVNELNKLQISLKENAERFPECLRRINKTTSQYITDLSFAAEAVKDESNAKIKAQEELIKPQISKLSSDYKQKIANVILSFDEEINRLEKLKTKTLKLIAATEKKIKQYERAAKKQAEKKHLTYEKRWKTKIRETKKELNSLKKELKRIDNNTKHLSEQKKDEISDLQLELDDKIKVARQPVLDLETTREAKMLAFKKQTEKLLNLEKPLVDGLNDATTLAQSVNDKFQMLGIKNPQLKGPALFYVPFYLACYQAGLAQRYIIFTPSLTNSPSLGSRLKGVMGISKIKEIFTPRFKAISALIEKVQTLTKQDSMLDQQIMDLGERNNLLKNELARSNISKGLVYLKDAGWLSYKEHQFLSNSLEQS